MTRFYAFLSRMKYIQRWSLMRANVAENIMEHSWQTAVIAHALAIIKNKKFGGKVNADHIATLALFHESSEVITGDLPTPVKYCNKTLTTAYKDLERQAEEKLLEMLPTELQEEYAPLITVDTQSEDYRIVKAADKLAAYIKSLEEVTSGNGECRKAKQSIEKELKKYEMPEVNYFLKECVPAFSLTLDELDLEEL